MPYKLINPRSPKPRLRTMVLEEGPQNTVTFSVTPRDDGTLDVFVGTIGRTPRYMWCLGLLSRSFRVLRVTVFFYSV